MPLSPTEKFLRSLEATPSNKGETPPSSINALVVAGERAESRGLSLHQAGRKLEALCAFQEGMEYGRPVCQFYAGVCKPHETIEAFIANMDNLLAGFLEIFSTRKLQEAAEAIDEGARKYNFPSGASTVDPANFNTIALSVFIRQYLREKDFTKKVLALQEIATVMAEILNLIVDEPVE